MGSCECTCLLLTQSGNDGRWILQVSYLN
jgi:hypothetical protein